MNARASMQCIDEMAARGLAPRPLRAADMKPGAVYISPTGRRCVLLESAGFGIACTSLVFRYLTRTGRASWDEGFALSAQNAQAIAAMREDRP